MKKSTAAYLVLMLALPILGLISLTVGSAALSVPELISGLFAREGYETATTILYAIRLPRTLAALLAGAGLALSGVLLQSVMGNPLASPNTIGINAGAGLAVIVCLSLAPTLTPLVPVTAFLGAMIALAAILLMAKCVGGTSHNTVILAGIACTALFQAGISLFNVLDDDVLVTYNAFSVGSLAGVGLSELILPTILIVGCLAVSFALSERISALTLGNAVASSLGIRVVLLRGICLILAGLSAASAVSFAGLLGFVGLVSPHLARKLFGHDVRRLILTAPPIGALTVCASDLAARTLFAPAELPVGIVMAFIGAPFLFILLIRKEKDHA